MVLFIFCQNTFFKCDLGQFFHPLIRVIFFFPVCILFWGFLPFLLILFQVRGTFMWSLKSELDRRVYSEKQHSPILGASPLTPHPLHPASTLAFRSSLPFLSGLAFWVWFLVPYKQKIHVNSIFLFLTAYVKGGMQQILICTFLFPLTIQPSNHARQRVIYCAW